ncbi:MAG: plasmid recombination protein [Muribaculaceae bacterium]|nr:plasmid recombination protein [Muribaculaceae bacterium]
MKEGSTNGHRRVSAGQRPLHVTVVPIVTTERKKKAKESNARKHYRTKPKNGPLLSADDIMTRENLTRYQDTYAMVMEWFGLERGIRGSEARHVDQHEYYRQCQIEKKGLEQDVAKLSTEKKKLSREKTALESDNRKLADDNRYLEGKRELYKETNERLKTDCETLTRTKRELIATNNSLVPEVTGFPDQMTQRILAQQSVGFSGKLFSPEHNQKFSTEHSEAKLERDPEKKHCFILKIDGVSVFQWFRDMARKLLEKMGFRQSESRQRGGIRR